MISVPNDHYRPHNMARSAENGFQKAGNGYLKAGNGLVGHNFVSLDDIYPYPASKPDFSPSPFISPQNMARSVEMAFQTAGNGYLKAGNGLVGHNFVSVDDICPKPAS